MVWLEFRHVKLRTKNNILFHGEATYVRKQTRAEKTDTVQIHLLKSYFSKRHTCACCCACVVIIFGGLRKRLRRNFHACPAHL